jgi:hypothetical protein
MPPFLPKSSFDPPPLSQIISQISAVLPFAQRAICGTCVCGKNGDDWEGIVLSDAIYGWGLLTSPPLLTVEGK